MQPLMIEVAGAEKMAAPGMGQPIWLKTQITREGPYLCARTYMVVSGNPHVMNTRVDLRPIARVVAARVKRRQKGPQVGAFSFKIKNPFKAISRAVKSIGRSKLIKGIARGVKAVGKVAGKVGTAIVRSPITKGIVTAASFIYPPVGIAAAGALAAANKALDAIEKGAKVVKGVGGALRQVASSKKIAAKIRSMPALQRTVIMRGPIGARIRTSLVLAKKAAKTIAAARKNKGRIEALLKKSKRSKALFKKIALTAKFSSNTVQRDHARKLARIVRIAAEARVKAKGAAEKSAGAMPGLFVSTSGKLKKGKFRRVLKKAPGTSEGFVYRRKGIKRGRFQSLSPGQIQKVKAAKKRSRVLALKVKAMRKKNVAVKKWAQAKARAKMAATVYKRAAKKARSQNIRDKVKAKAALRLAKSRGMSITNRIRLARGLSSKIKVNASARARGVKTTAVKVKVASSAVRSFLRRLGISLPTVSGNIVPSGNSGDYTSSDYVGYSGHHL